MWVYFYPSNTETELKNAYIWEYVVPYLCFTANTAGSTVKLQKTWTPTTVTLETSTDWKNWNTYTFGSTITLSNIGDKVYWRNTSETDTWFNVGYSNNYCFVMSGSIDWSWDITSLLNKNFTNSLSTNYCFSYLFKWCTALKTPPELPATTLSEWCYSYMFQNCSWLTITPELPATTLAESCYGGMFYNCASLKTFQSFMATSLWPYCCQYMFYWCTGLENIPSYLPATTLAGNCYYGMFYGCSSITTAPELPATTLAENCYASMFYWCASLTTLVRLPATTLPNRCYQAMFVDCSKIKLSTSKTWEYQTAYRIPSSWSWSIWTDSLYYMFGGTWWTFTWTPTINTTYYTSNTIV